jgi:hypothetical protein
MRWVGQKPRIVEMGNAYINSDGKPDAKRQFSRPRYKWGNNIKTDLKKT